VFPGNRILGIQPTLDLLAVSEVEDTYNSSLYVRLAACRTHNAEGTEVLIVPEHIVLSEPESPCDKFG